MQQWSLQEKIGNIIPQSQRISAKSAIDAVKAAYQNKGFTPFYIQLPGHAEQPYNISLENMDKMPSDRKCCIITCKFQIWIV
ncbi:MAG: hypothetical protein V7L29_10965 [Nostoc sp.]|uniref:hypothetical protein n=1 Tax=Nostoc sp. TaxID=1180 RepID=UPI002FEF674E